MWIHHLLYKLNKMKHKIDDAFEDFKDFIDYATDDFCFTLMIVMFSILAVVLLILLFCGLLY